MISVLYVDDEPELCELGKVFLEKNGEFSVTTRTSAQEALLFLDTRSVDAVISDYQMPEMDGIEFLQKVRADGGSTPFILFTGRGREEVVIQAINFGADFYLQKGGDPAAQFAELAHKIRIAVERRQAVEALKDSEQRLSDLINFLPDATFAIDRSGTVLSWNRAIEEMTGVPAADMLGKGNFEYAIPFYGTRRKILIDLIFESDEVIATNYAHIFHEKDTLIAETSLPRPKGKAVILLGKASPLYNRQGTIIGAIESIRDITGLRRAEDEATHSKKDWEAIFRSIGHPALVLDADNHVIDANDATARVTGLSPSELIGKRCYELFHAPGTTSPPEDCPFEKIKKGSVTGTSESEIQALGGFFDVSCTPVFDADGRLEKVIHIAMDVTDRHRAQEELMAAYEQMTASQEELKAHFDELAASEQRIRESEMRFRELAEMLPQGIFEMDLQYRITYANRYALSAFGMTEQDMEIGLNALQVISPEDHGRIQQNIEKLLRGIAYDDHEYTVVRKDRSTFPVLIYSAPIRRSGQLAGFRGVITDISVRKKTEMKLLESERTLSGIFSVAPVGIVLVSDRVMLRVNGKICEISGYREEELVGKNTRFLYLSDDDYEMVGKVKYNTDQKYGLDSVESRWRRKDGTIRDILLSGTPLDPKKPQDAWIVIVLDITDTKRMERNIQESRQQLDNFMQNLPVGVFRTTPGPSGRRIMANPIIAKMHGFDSVEEFMQVPVADLYADPQERARISDILIHEGVVIDAEIRLKKKNGEEFQARLSSIAVRGPDGKVEYFDGVISDITERRQQEKNLKIQLELGLALQEIHGMDETLDSCLSAAIAISGMDAGGIYLVDTVTGAVDLMVSRNLGEAFRALISHYPAESPNARMIAAGVPLYMPFDKTGIVHTDIQKQEGLHALAIIPVSFNGRVIACMNITSHRHDEIPHTSRIALETIATQIGAAIERIRSEESLRESEERLKLALDGGELGTWNWNVQTGEVIFNQRWAGMLGYRLEDIEPHVRSWEHLINPEDLPRVMEVLSAHLDGRTPRYECEHRLLHRNGEWIWVLDKGEVIHRDPDGRPLLAAGTHLDITRRKKAEEALSEANRKLRLLGSMTRHDLINQMTALRGFIQIALKKENDPVIKGYLEKLRDISETISSQIEFTRLYQDMGVNAPAWFRLDEVVSSVTGSFPVTQTEPCRTVEIFTDPMIAKVFFNLFDNAVQHGGGVTRINVSCSQEPDGLKIVVEDNGTGIPARDKVKIFERGYGRHTGLGLFLAKEILAITGITIRETGETGAGARFEITVPARAFRVPPGAPHYAPV